jgi:hypothetical protein
MPQETQAEADAFLSLTDAQIMQIAPFTHERESQASHKLSPSRTAGGLLTDKQPEAGRSRDSRQEEPSIQHFMR